MSFFDAISPPKPDRPFRHGGLSLTGAPYPIAPVETSQTLPNFVSKKEIGSKVGHFSLSASFWLPLKYSYKCKLEVSLLPAAFGYAALSLQEIVVVVESLSSSWI